MAFTDILNNLQNNRFLSPSLDIDNSQKQFSYVDSRDLSTSTIYAQTYNIDSPYASGSNITTKKEASTSASQSESQEKPISISPALFGGGSTTATGSSEASSGLNPTAIAGVIVAGALGFLLIGGAFKKKKK